MAELVDALDSKSSFRKEVRVRPPLRVPFIKKLNATIRRGRESDMPALRDIINHYITNSVVTFEMVEMSLENRQTWFTQFTNDGRHQLMVAESNGEILGYAASLRFLLRPAYAPSVMTSIYLRQDQVGKGIGQKMFEWAIDCAKAQKAHVLQLTTDKKRPEALHFYEKLGFRASHEGMKLHFKS